MNVERIRTVKLPAFLEGWRRRFGAPPSRNATILGLSVPLHETGAGDSWPGPDGKLDTQDDEHNWGATTLRRLRAHEQFLLGASAFSRIYDSGLPVRGDRLAFNNFRYHWQVYDHASKEPDVASMQRDLGVEVDGNFGPKTKAKLEEWYPGAEPALYWPKIKQSVALNPNELEAVRPIHPSVVRGIHPARAAEAMRVLTEGFGKDQLPPAVIHCDSTPKEGAYFVWFAAFTTDADGAHYFLKFMAYSDNRSALETGDPMRLAAAMYGNRYFTGFHDPDKTYEKNGRTLTGDEANIADYASGIRKHMPSVEAAL